MSESMVERVARAFYDAHPWGDEDAGTNGFDKIPSDWREVYRNGARAAIEAMREPTPEMFEAFGADIDWEVFPGYWSRAIDAALKP